MRTYKRLLAVAATVSILIVAACSEGNNQPSQKESKSDSTIAPNSNAGLSVYQLEGKWLTQNNEIITLNALKGKVQVMAMVFTHCEVACPKIVNDMQKIQDELPANIRNKVGFTLVSFDVARDTLGRLKAFAREMGLNSNWTVLRGNEQEVRELSLLLDVNYEKQDNGGFSHTNVITVLNPDGVIAYRHEGLEIDAKEIAGKILATVK